MKQAEVERHFASDRTRLEWQLSRADKLQRAIYIESTDATSAFDAIRIGL